MQQAKSGQDGSALAALREAMLEHRLAIEALLSDATESGQPLSLLERGRLDDHVAEIKRLAAHYERLRST
jgi:hypothetical protein